MNALLKRIIALLLLGTALAGTLSLAACGKNDVVKEEDQNKPGNDDNPGGNSDKTPLFAFGVTDVTASTATIFVSCQNSRLTYYFDVLEKEFVELNYGAGNYNTAFDDVIDYNTLWFESNGGSWNDLLSQGDDVYEFPMLKGDTEYYVMACGVIGGVRTTDVEAFEFTTTSVVPSDMTFEVSVEGSLITVNPSTDEQWCFGVLEKQESYDEASDNTFIDFFVNRYGNDLYYYVFNGAQQFDYYGMLFDGTTYIIFVFGYDGGATTPLTRYEFTYHDTYREELTTLTGDHDFSGGNYASMTPLGDYYRDGTCAWELWIENEERGEFFQTTLMSAADKGPEGSYAIDLNWSYAPGTAMGGQAAFEYIFGTWWGLLDDYGYVIGAAPGDEGTITVAKEGDGYRIDAEFLDPLGNKVTVAYAGEVEMHTWSGPVTSAAGAKALRRARPAAARAAKPAATVGATVVNRAAERASATGAPRLKTIAQHIK